MDEETKKYIDEQIAIALNKVTAITLKIQLDQFHEAKQTTKLFKKINHIFSLIIIKKKIKELIH